MRKLVPFVLAVVGSLLFASCSDRDYTCVCQYDDINGARRTVTTTVNGTLSESRDACNRYGQSLGNYVKSATSCYVK